MPCDGCSGKPTHYKEHKRQQPGYTRMGTYIRMSNDLRLSSLLAVGIRFVGSIYFVTGT